MHIRVILKHSNGQAEMGRDAFPANLGGYLPETPILATARTGLFRPTGLRDAAALKIPS
ncbi:MAG: hypothetical protein QX199_13760 [Methylococcaceae bacterium]